MSSTNNTISQDMVSTSAIAKQKMEAHVTSGIY